MVSHGRHHIFLFRSTERHRIELFSSNDSHATVCNPLHHQINRKKSKRREDISTKISVLKDYQKKKRTNGVTNPVKVRFCLHLFQECPLKTKEVRKNLVKQDNKQKTKSNNKRKHPFER